MTSHWAIILELVSRYLHIVCTTLLVGGTLFYEMVVPIAIDDLREEQQLYVFARARWVFKWIVWISASLLLASGILATKSHWEQYTNEGYITVTVPVVHSTDEHGTATTVPTTAPASAPTTPTPPEMRTLHERVVPPAGRPGWWWAAHASAGVVALLVALSLTIGPVPPSRPIRWMRLNLVILLLVIFLATTTRQARLTAEERHPGPPSLQNGAD